MAMKRPGIYAPLSAYYFDDAAIMEVGEDAELLYVRMLAYAARQMEFEGFISDRVITSRLGITARESGNGTGNGTGNVPGTDAGSRAGILAEYGLLTREEGGYRITGWLKWNKSAAELGKERTRDRQRKNAPDNGVRSDGSGNDTGNDTGKRSGTDTGIRRQRPDQTRPDTDQTLGDGSSSIIETADGEVCSSADAESEDDEISAELIPFDTKPRPANIDADFADWWEHYPRKVGKGQAIKAYRTARKKATAEALVAAVDIQSPMLTARGSQYCPHPATWLNGERWRDEPADLQASDPKRFTRSDWEHLAAHVERSAE